VNRRRRNSQVGTKTVSELKDAGPDPNPVNSEKRALKEREKERERKDCRKSLCSLATSAGSRVPGYLLRYDKQNLVELMALVIDGW
jgi:hypothetical protein